MGVRPQQMTETVPQPGPYAGVVGVRLVVVTVAMVMAVSMTMDVVASGAGTVAVVPVPVLMPVAGPLFVGVRRRTVVPVAAAVRVLGPRHAGHGDTSSRLRPLSRYRR